MKIGIIGVGFVGGATAEVLKPYHELYLYDKYKSPYNREEYLSDLAKNSECVFICVPTPMKPSGEIDFINIHNSLKTLLESVKKENRNPEDILVIIRSTSVPGTTDELKRIYLFRFSFNPEFLREKYALEDMKNTDRIVIGSDNEEDAKKTAQIYKIIFPNAKYFLVDTKTAEMIKYAANCMLLGQIALANELYFICDSMGIEYNKVKETILHDMRIGRNLDVPGPDGDFGFGGKCFPKDLNAIIFKSKEHSYNPSLLEAIWQLNLNVRKKKDWLDIAGATSENNFDGKKD